MFTKNSLRGTWLTASVRLLPIFILNFVVLHSCTSEVPPNGCPPGTVEGKCGLEGKCIECVTDVDCASGKCLIDGSCAFTHFTSICQTDGECPSGMICTDDGTCRISCNAPTDCEFPVSYCRPEGYCDSKRCGRDGKCPEGWEPVEGSLGCILTDCSVVMLVEGICGLAGSCVECIDDSNCPHGSICLKNGSCSSDSSCGSNSDCDADQSCNDEKGICMTPCFQQAHCAWGEVCAEGFCKSVKCGSDGLCPEDWKIEEGSLFCEPILNCSPGLIPGQCGLSHKCVECITDDDCALGKACNYEGSCVDFEPCGPENSCPSGQRCGEDGRCWKGCYHQYQCPNTTLCGENSYCFSERCNSQGTCPTGWEPINGSLMCKIESCESFGFIQGGCGLKDKCVDCITDEHCEHPLEYCDLQGDCGYPNEPCNTDQECGIYFEQIVCRDGDCQIDCESDIDCPLGFRCWGYCRFETCQANGDCPEDWVPVTGWYVCEYDPCASQGKLTGACGLSGQCVDCFVDEHCPGDDICNLFGECTARQCDTDLDCDLEDKCENGRCFTICLSDADCSENELCEPPSGTCEPIICNENGTCGVWGWYPVQDSLSCTYRPCYWLEGYMPGTCGRSNECVECFADSDCDAEHYCDIYGKCIDYPGCGPDTTRSCGALKICIDGRCHLRCESDEDCANSAGECQLEGYCFFERCSSEGECPDGWYPGTRSRVNGLLACVKE
jgi:hypothetical protein